MATKYGALDDLEQELDLAPMAEHEVEVRILGFLERDIKKDPAWSQKVEIVRVVGDADLTDTFAGAKFDQLTFVTSNSQINLNRIKKMFQKAGFEVDKWVKGGEYATSIMLPACMRFLAVKQMRVIGKVAPHTKDGNTRHYFNFQSISKVDEDGKPLPGVQEVYTNEEVLAELDTPIEGQETVKNPKSFI